MFPEQEEDYADEQELSLGNMLGQIEDWGHCQEWYPFEAFRAFRLLANGVAP